MTFEFVWCNVEGAGEEDGKLRLAGPHLAALVFITKMNGRQKTCRHSSLHQGTDDSPCIEAAQIVVGLPCAHKHDRLACDVGHGDGSANLWAEKERF